MRAMWANVILVLVALALGVGMYTHWGRGKPHNVILFVADGLRSGIVTPQTAPALAALRSEGVDFQNSHSLYPTITTANASAIATGHGLGDTGDFSNTLYAGPEPLPFPVSATTSTVEDDAVLALMNARFGGNYLGEATLLAAARAKGFSTAAIGKLGPVAIQDVTERTGLTTIVIDDSTGLSGPDSIPLAPDLKAAIEALGLPTTAPDRGLNGDSGAYNMPGVRVANVDQQDWFTKVATEVLLPRFKAANKPFVMVFWSRDPDGTQHNQGDSLNTETPGINGPTTMAAIRNVSNDLQRLRDALKAQGLDQTTDIIVTADHGFSTTSKQSQTSASAKLTYRDVPSGFLPAGFLGIDLSLALKLPIWQSNGLPVEVSDGFHPKSNAVLGADPKHPEMVITANGGTDLIYLTGADPKAMARRIVPPADRRGLYRRGVRQRRPGADPRDAADEPDQPDGRRAHAPAFDPGGIHQPPGRLRQGHLPDHHRRHRPAAGPGPARLIRQRRHPQLHGRRRSGLQKGLRRSDPRVERRPGPHHRPGAAHRPAVQGRADRAGHLGGLEGRQGARPHGQDGALAGRRRRLRDRARLPGSRRRPLFRRGGDAREGGRRTALALATAAHGG